MSTAAVRQRRLAPVRSSAYARSSDVLRLRYRRVRRLVAKARAAMPWLDESDVPVLRSWCELEIIGAGLFADLTAAGITNGEGEPRRAVDDLRRLRQTQLGFARELGMTPRARAELSVDSSRTRALTAAAQIAEQRRMPT